MQIRTIDQFNEFINLTRTLPVGVDKPTPYLLVDKMIKLPDLDWKDPNLRILDPAFGFGTFLFACYLKLIPYHSEEHILNNMLYGVEIDSFRYRITKHNLGIKNLFLADFLSWETDMKFHVIVGNPPYGRDDRADKGNKVKGYKQNPWPLFVKKSFELLNEEGILAYITPKGWLAGTYDIREGRYKIIDEVQKRNLIYLNISNSLQKEYFNGVGSSFSVYIIENKSYDGTTEFVTDYGTSEIDFSTVDVLPPDPNPILLSINNKTLWTSTEKFDFRSVSFTQNEAGQDSEKMTEEYKYKGYCNGSDRGKKLICTYWKTPDRYVGMRKVLLGKQDRSYLPYVDDEGLRIGQNQLWYLELQDNQTKAAADSVFHSKLFKFLIMLNKHGAGPETILTKNLPAVSLTQIWTNEKLYNHFNLTQEEIDYIEANVK